MEEEIKQEEPKQEPTMIAAAVKAAEALKAENARMEANIARLQELKAFEALGGKSEGRAQETKPVEIDPAVYADLALKGKLPLK